MRANAALLVASSVVAVVMVEAALHAVHPQWAIPFPSFRYRPDLFERWEAYGYRLHPSRRLRDVHPFPHGRTVTVTANADGFRSRRELREADARPRMLVLGDSMVFGPGVEEPERLTERVEALEPAWRVDNLGMVGFGADLMLRALGAASRRSGWSTGLRAGRSGHPVAEAAEPGEHDGQGGLLPQGAILPSRVVGAMP